MARRKKQKNWGAYAMVFFMILMMVTWTLAIVFVDNPQGGGASASYNGYEFSADSQGRYVTEVDGEPAYFHHLPAAAASVSYDEGVTPLVRGAEALVVAFDPQSSQLGMVDLVRFELASALSTSAGVLSSSDSYDFPVVSCEQASAQYPVLRIVEGDPAITLDGSCVTMSGNGTSLALAKDSLLYNYHGVV